MQLAKVVITSILILAVRAGGLPESKGCVLKYISDVKFPQIVVCYTKVVCSNNYLLYVHYV